MRRRRRVLLCISGWFGLQRRVIQGIVQYGRGSSKWDFVLMKEWSNWEELKRNLRESDGVILEGWKHRLVDEAVKSGRAAVAVLQPSGDEHPIPFVSEDEQELASRVFSYLHGLGHRRMSYWCANDREMSGRHFVELCNRHGVACDVTYLDPIWMEERDQAAARRRRLKGLMQQQLPWGIFCRYVDVASSLVDDCAALGLSVPRDVAILTYGGDEVLCDLAHVPLSQVEDSGVTIGYEAARILDCLMRGEDPRQTALMIPSREVTVRESTNALAVENPDVAAALRMIRKGVGDGITVEQIVREIAISRRRLEYAFKAVLGRSIYAEIQRTQIDVARRLLTTTELPLAQVSLHAGFAAPSRLSVVFKGAMGMTPSAYRNMHCRPRSGHQPGANIFSGRAKRK